MAPPENKICLAHAGKELGEFTRAEIAQMLAQGKVDQTSWFWTEGMPEWRAVGDLDLGLRAQPASRSLPSVDSPLILVVGMRHSGSTALFNILRLGLAKSNKPCASCYTASKRFAEVIANPCATRLVKIHEYRADLATSAGLVFTARRDLREAAASAVRRNFPLIKSLGGVVDYAGYNRYMHDGWEQHADFAFCYEEFMANPGLITGHVLAAAGLATEGAADVLSEVQNLPTDDYETTLLSPSHITDPERKLSFRDTLSPEQVEEIEERHSDWLGKFGYALSVTRP